MMNALEFLKARKRMCEAKNCDSCKLYHMQGGCCVTPKYEKIDAYEKVIAIVEQWAAEHPAKTRQSVFLEQWPETRIGYDGVLQINPCSISASHRNALGNCTTMGRECHDCRREFWMQEVEE